MPVQTRSQSKTIRSKSQVNEDKVVALSRWLMSRLLKLQTHIDNTIIQEDRTRLFIEFFEIVNEYSDLIKPHSKLNATFRKKSEEFLPKLTDDKREDRILRETLKTTLNLLN